jgi:hypothetical protein
VSGHAAGQTSLVSSTIITVTNWQSTSPPVQSIWPCSMNASMWQYRSVRLIALPPARAAGHSWTRSGSARLVATSRASDLKAARRRAAPLGAAAQRRRDRRARPGERSAGGQLDRIGAELATEHQHIDHLLGCLRGADLALDRL